MTIASPATGHATARADRGLGRERPTPSILGRRSLRSEVLGVVLGINLLAAGVAGLVVIWNARVRADREMSASVAVAEQFIRESVTRFADAGYDAPRVIPPILAPAQRHVRVRLELADGRVIPLVPAKAAPEEGVPKWFSALVSAREITREIPLVVDGRQGGRIIVAGAPGDEIAEVWENVRDFVAIGVGVNLAILLALYFALGRVMAQLGVLAEGLGELERGRFARRMVPPAGRELAALTERFNALAGALDTARQDNARLTRELVSTQDDERRQIAADLHDELGPCLFGLEANAGSLQRLAGEVASPVAGRLLARVATIIDIVERMRTLNRRLLQRLRPAAFDHVALSDALANLVADFARHAPEREFLLDVGRLAPRYNDGVGITLYRCIQEGVTNALKHGDAKTVQIDVREVATEAGNRLCLRIRDDGHGLPAEPALGMGLTGMAERVRAIGGSCRVAAAEDGGACLAVDIPVETEPRDSDEPRPEEGGSS